MKTNIRLQEFMKLYSYVIGLYKVEQSTRSIMYINKHTSEMITRYLEIYIPTIKSTNLPIVKNIPTNISMNYG